jgi:hypothetical protein
VREVGAEEVGEREQKAGCGIQHRRWIKSGSSLERPPLTAFCRARSPLDGPSRFYFRRCTTVVSVSAGSGVGSP